MKLNYSSMKTGGYLLAFFLLFGILVTVASSTAQAQYRDRNDRYGNDRYRRDRDWDYRNRYNSYYGNRGQYRQVFRDAFLQGYREGFQRFAYNRRGRWGNRWP